MSNSVTAPPSLRAHPQRSTKEMKSLALILISLNVIVLAYLIIGARSELPIWQNEVKEASNSVEALSTSSPIEEIQKSVAISKLNSLESSLTEVITEYRRSEVPLFALSCINLVGWLFLLARKKKEEPGELVNSSAAAGLSENHLHD